MLKSKGEVKLGAVRKEILSQNIGIHEYEVYNFSEENIIKELIKNRSQIDKFYAAKYFDSNNNINFSSDVPIFHELIEDIYLDLDELIKQTKLTDNQKEIVNLLMLGHTEEDIARRLKKDNKSVEKSFSIACKRLKEQNDKDWAEWIETSGNIKVKENYKQCRKCGKWLKANKENFSSKKDAKDGLHVYCKKCR
ncbi:MAG TPA: hypothetical protein VF941_11030 [Clostridia bacterium]